LSRRDAFAFPFRRDHLVQLGFVLILHVVRLEFPILLISQSHCEGHH
jgi:hypothetical protein